MVFALRAFSWSGEIGASGLAPVAACGDAGAVAASRGCASARGQAEHTKIRIGKNCFIPLEGVIGCNQNCSVSCGLPARSGENSSQNLDAGNAPIASWRSALFIAFFVIFIQPKPLRH